MKARRTSPATWLVPATPSSRYWNQARYCSAGARLPSAQPAHPREERIEMQYMLMFRPTEESIAQFERLSPQEQSQQVTVVQQWLKDNRAISFARLQPPKTAKTVRIKGSQPPVVTDG